MMRTGPVPGTAAIMKAAAHGKDGIKKEEVTRDAWVEGSGIG
ncbi:MAG: hypothetical protein ACLTBV_02915 [Enterocloster bolteae]